MNRKKYVWKLLCCLLLMTATAWSGILGTAAKATEKEEMLKSSLPALSAVRTEATEADASITCPVSRMGALSPPFLCAPSEAIDPQALEGLTLCPGGMPFGVKFMTEGITVVGFCDVELKSGKTNPAASAGLKLRDVILKVDGETLAGAAQLTAKIEACNGKALTLLCRRGNEEMELHLTPVYSEAEARYKTGIWVRDSGAGIGTVTFIMPETGAFAGLGHGICDADTGALVSMRRGTVMDVTVSSVVKGTAGNPGELKGYFNPGKIGSLIGNTTCGVFGILTELPDDLLAPLPVGLRTDLQEGAATILCTLDSNKRAEYDVEICNVNRDALGSKCFTVKVTDPDLLAVSGGIVQGMSGSPIIQNGKLVGAVTHVLVGDPTTGYGIFVENMLNAANLPMAKAS